MNYDDQVIAEITAGGFPYPRPPDEAMSGENYEWIKSMAVHQAGRQILDALDIMKLTIFCRHESAEEEENSVPLNVFRWSYSHFIHRRSFSPKSFAIILNALRFQCLEEQKMQSDIDELHNLAKLILMCFLNQDEYKYFDIEAYLRGMETATFHFQPLVDEYTRNKEEFMNYKNSITIIDIAQHFALRSSDAKTSSVKMFTQDLISQALKQSYIKRHCETFVEVESMKIENEVDHLLSEIDETEQKITNENNRFALTMNMLHDQTEMLKDRVAKKTRLYDVDYEKVLNVGAYLRSQMDKMRTMRQFYEEELKRFAEELKDMAIKDEKRREAEAARQGKLDSKKSKRRRKGTQDTIDLTKFYRKESIESKTVN